ncbi:unnamed protein product [Ostreobium quekettii]|uniref:Integral membrane protein TerC n=1 Tax=Ostreobium quekettii TaxID=121088 RepID=A0A8S1J6N3_9CHLO|nr:unnamed protein product [Ostreobium quekettii]|eukprot:evm.model.scf_544.4 EVM.evm.TU.scf_544.4   scf_544:19178-23314(+)
MGSRIASWRSSAAQFAHGGRRRLRLVKRERGASSLSRPPGHYRPVFSKVKAVGDQRTGDAGGTLVSSTEEEDAAMEIFQSFEGAEDVEFRGESVAAWVGAAFAFGAGVWYFLGSEKAEEYFAGYLLEQSLSVDNLFVFILVFNYFQTPTEFQPKVLTYGIVTAAVLRLVMVVLGVELIDSFKPVLLGFAGLLLYSSYNLIVGGNEDEEDLGNNGVVKLCKRVLRVSDAYDGENFFTLENGVRVATPLLLALAVVELSDVVFAVDSVPAVFGVTLDPFIVYTSNMFAILSLRSLYGFVSVIMTELRYLDKAVALVLGFIGVKMIADFTDYHISTELSLLVVGVLLGGGVAASLWLPEPADGA